MTLCDYAMTFFTEVHDPMLRNKCAHFGVQRIVQDIEREDAQQSRLFVAIILL